MLSEKPVELYARTSSALCMREKGRGEFKSPIIDSESGHLKGRNRLAEGVAARAKWYLWVCGVGGAHPSISWHLGEFWGKEVGDFWRPRSQPREPCVEDHREQVRATRYVPTPHSDYFPKSGIRNQAVIINILFACKLTSRRPPQFTRRGVECGPLTQHVEGGVCSWRRASTPNHHSPSAKGNFQPCHLTFGGTFCRDKTSKTKICHGFHRNLTVRSFFDHNFQI